MTTRERTRTLVRRLGLSVAVLLALFLVASAVGARVAVAGSRSAPPLPATSVGDHYEDVTFTSRVDRLRLSGWLFHADHASGRSVVFVHGWRGGREDVDFVPLARAMLARGYDVLLFDLRGSGSSAGSHETLAHLEPRDVLGAVDFMRARGYQPRTMTVLGNSMGAAAVIEAAPRLRSVGALVCDSAFADLSETLANGLTSFTGLPGFLAFPAAQLARAFDVEPSLRPVDVVHALPDRAFLFLHARGDQLIPLAQAHELRSASDAPGSRLVVLDGTEHLDTYTHAPHRYLRVLLAFITSQLDRGP